MSILLVLCSHPDSVAADALATALVEQRLAACVNILPGARSVYRWEGQIERALETLLLIKTTTDRFDSLKEHLVTAHPHAVPEVLALDVVAGLDRYLEWVRDATALIGATE
ncbi:MAG: divalent-cation tolerance protein CutA [Lysobacteraceae bacterium]